MKASFQILLNHIGYDVRGSKRLVIKSAEDCTFTGFTILNADGSIAFHGPLQRRGKVAGWKDEFFHDGDFSTIDRPGKYRVQVGEVTSDTFSVRERVLAETCLADVIYYFKIQRCSGAFDKADHLSLIHISEPTRPY